MVKLSFDPGNPATAMIWIGGQPTGFLKINESLRPTREERISSFSTRLAEKIAALEAEYPHQIIEEVAIELMGDSGPTHKKKGLIALGISTGQIEGYFKGRGIPVRWVYTGKNCKYYADLVCDQMGLTVKENSHEADAVYIGFLAKYDQVIDDPTP